MAKTKINIITLGCSKNLVDSEILMRQLGDNYSISHESGADADIPIVNTCGFNSRMLKNRGVPKRFMLPDVFRNVTKKT